jgi:O-antigen/teichoic acid export membrane protein
MRSVRHGALWTLIGYGATQVIRFGSSLILTRLLLQADYGTSAFVFSLLTGICMVGDLGVWAAIIQNPGGQQRPFRNTAWTLQWIRSVVLGIAAFAVAPAIADARGDPALVGMIGWATLSMCIGNVVPTSLYVANRNLDLAKIAAIELTAQVVSTSVTILWAWRDPRPEAMVYGSLVNTLVRYAMIRGLFGGGDRLAWHRPAVRAILRYGVWTALSSMVYFAVGQADKLVFAVLVSNEMLGVYAIAATLAAVPGEVMSRLTTAVLFPILSRAVKGNALDPVAFRRYRAPLFAFTGWAVASLAGGAPAVVGLLYPTGWSDAAWMLQLLVIAIWINSALEGPRTTALLSLGHSRWLFLTGLGKLVLMPLLIPLGHAWLGFPGAILAYAVADLGRLTVSLIGCRMFGVRDFWLDAVMTAWVAVTALLGHFACSLTSGWFEGSMHPRIAHGLSAICVGIVVGLAWAPQLLQFRRIRRELAAPSS